MADKEYYPLKKGSIQKYRSDDGESSHALIDEVLSVETKGGETKAKVRHTIEKLGRAAEVSEFEVRRDASGVYNNGEQELALPIKVGKTWEIESREFRIASVSEKVSVPAGEFADCLVVAYKIGDGDGGGGEIFYAPGVGMVKYSAREESQSFDIVLTSRS